MLLNSSLAAVTWWTAALVIIAAADVVIWIFSFLHLPAQRRNAILKAVTLCWLMIPAAVICVFAAHDIMTTHISFTTAVFGHSPDTHATAARLIAQPQWRIGANLIGWIETWGNVGFGLLALLACVWLPSDQFSKRARSTMALVPALFMLCVSLMLSG